MKKPIFNKFKLMKPKCFVSINWISRSKHSLYGRYCRPSILFNNNFNKILIVLLFAIIILYLLLINGFFTVYAMNGPIQGPIAPVPPLVPQAPLPVPPPPNNPPFQPITILPGFRPGSVPADLIEGLCILLGAVLLEKVIIPLLDRFFFYYIFGDYIIKNPVNTPELNNRVENSEAVITDTNSLNQIEISSYTDFLFFFISINSLWIIALFISNLLVMFLIMYYISRSNISRVE